MVSAPVMRKMPDSTPRQNRRPAPGVRLPTPDSRAYLSIGILTPSRLATSIAFA